MNITETAAIPYPVRTGYLSFKLSTETAFQKATYSEILLQAS